MCSWMQVCGPAPAFDKALTNDKKKESTLIFHKANFRDILYSESMSFPCFDDDFSSGDPFWNVNIYRHQRQSYFVTLLILNPKVYNLSLESMIFNFIICKMKMVRVAQVTLE